MRSIEKVQSQLATTAISDRLFDILRPPPRLKPSEWADTYRELSREANAKGGRWRSKAFQKEPMDSAMDPDVRLSVLIWASQLGKTEILLNTIAFFIHQDPAPILVMQPTLEMGEAFSKDRIDPMLRDTAVLAKLITQNSRDKQQTIMHKRFPGGHLTISGANSPASLASRPIRIRLSDEIDRYDESAGEEGDPCALAARRQDSFWNAVSFETSTPLIRGRSRIERKFLMSDQRRWFVPCHKCDHKQTLIWKQVKWGEDPSKAHYECENCHTHWNDDYRRKNVMKGEWIPTAPFNGIRGYHLNGINNLFAAKKGFKTRIHQMVVEFLEAKEEGAEALRVWTNTFLAETWADDEEDKKPAPSALALRRRPISKQELPNGIVMLYAGVDEQKDRLEYEIVGFGRNEETWGVEYGVIPGDPREADNQPGSPWQKLEAILLRQYKRQDGATLSLSGAGIDTGYPLAIDATHSFIYPRQSRNWRGIKGSSIPDAPIVVDQKHAAKRADRVRLLLVGTNRLKGLIYDRAALLPPPEDGEKPTGWMNFPDTYADKWFEGLLVETSKPFWKAGVRYRQFDLPEGKRNEPLDCRVYALAMYHKRGPVNWDAEDNRIKQTIVDKTKQESKYEGRQHPIARGGVFPSGWNI